MPPVEDNESQFRSTYLFAQTAADATYDWVELLSEDRWLRAQLTWLSPRNTLFMFTSDGRRSHSMTSRMMHQLLAANRLRIISEQGVPEGALQSVTRTDVRSSVDI